MHGSQKALAVPVLVIALGTGWLLNALGVLPGVDWAWTGALGILGAMTLVFGRLNRVSAVVGPFLFIASGFSIMRQTGWLSVNIEVPCLLIVFGVLLMVVQLAGLPLPDWLRDESKFGKPGERDAPR